MEFFRYAMRDTRIDLYPLCCWHVGARQSDGRFIDKVIADIKKNPKARWIYLGDGGECVTKQSKGVIYEQELTPGEQMTAVRTLLEPIKDKGLFGIRGNHGARIFKETGVEWDETLMTMLGVPYRGISCLASIELRDRSTHQKCFSIYAHHGVGNAITPGGKMTAAHKAEQIALADVILVGHTHVAGEAWPIREFAYTDHRHLKVKWRRSRTYICGSAYDSRIGGYAEEKMYPPLTPIHLVVGVQLRRKIDGKGTYLVYDTRKIEAFEEIDE